MIPEGAEASTVRIGHRELRRLRSSADHPDGRLPLVLIHGGGADNSAISWFHAFVDFGIDRQVLAFDLPGFGGSSDVAPVGGPVAMADLVAEAIRASGFDRVAVAGVSMGGDVALNLALRDRELCAGLILIAPGGLIPVLRNRLVQAAAKATACLPDLLLLPATALANRFVGQALRAMVHAPDRLPDQVVAEFVAEARAPRGGLGYLRYNQATLGWRAMTNDLLPQVQRITVPTLFFHGAEDRLVPLAGSREAARRMPDAELLVVPDCGHWAQLEAPVRFAAAANRFLHRLDT
ncbi:alpha/beta fold hydrolase [Naumannella halotolerans]|uniref:alpha/beta fold hydrolase n=1 Tax=Naumannella halotolerans TaxID=993414 RepID=UPI00370D9D18